MPTRVTAVERRTEKLDLRVTPKAKQRLQAAASLSHRTMSDFVLESALAQAEQTLADRRFFTLDMERWTHFQEVLDAPVQPLPRLKALLTKPGFFDAQPRKAAAR